MTSVLLARRWMEDFIKHNSNRLTSDHLIKCTISLTPFYLDIIDLILFQNKTLKECREFV